MITQNDVIFILARSVKDVQQKQNALLETYLENINIQIEMFEFLKAS